MKDNKQEVETSVEVKDMSIDEILGTPGASSVITGEEEEKKPTVLSTNPVDTSFLNEDPSKSKDKDDEDEDENGKGGGDDKPTPTTDEVNEFLSMDKDKDDEENDDEPSGSSSGVYQNVFNKLVEEGKILAFDEDAYGKKLEDYDDNDYKDLLESNLENAQQVGVKQFFDSMPPKVQYLIKYAADGASEEQLDAFYGSIRAAEEVANYTLENEEGQEQIIREYLRATGFGEEEDIQDEIETWKDLGKLEDKASKFKPKLDKMQEKVVQQKMAQQEAKMKERHAALQHYRDNIFETLKEGSLNEIELDQKTKAKLFAGLVQSNYQSVSGNKTNLLGHLLEKHQWGPEPRHDLILEALWLLSNPEEYKSKLKGQGSKEQTIKTVKKLKGVEQSKSTSSNATQTTEQSSKKVKTLKPNPNMLKW